MFKSWSIKKYGYKLHNTLIKRYGAKHYYTNREVRATVYQCNFNPKYLPLAYILYLSPSQLGKVMNKEFPELNIGQYKQEMFAYFSNKSNNMKELLNQA